MKLPAYEKERRQKRALAELAERGIGGEANNARAALAKLCEKYDFDTVAVNDTGDIFEGIQIASGRAGEAHRVFGFRTGEADFANLVKWALESRFKIRGFFRDTGICDCELWMNARAADMPTLRRLAESIRGDFKRLWLQFSAAPGIVTGDRPPFLTGLYDGMMDEERKTGERVPQPRGAVARKERKGRRKAVALAPGVALHPYTFGLDLGRRVRFCVPIGEIEKEIADRAEAAQLTQCAGL